MNIIEESKEDIGWQEMTCLEEKIFFKMPQDWERAGDEIIAHKFPYAIKPQETFTNPEDDRFLTWNLLDKPLQETQVYPAIREIQKLINHIYPECILKPAGQIQAETWTAGYFVFVTGGIQYDVAHCMFILPVREKMMLGSYHFPIEKMADDMQVFMEILKSIQIAAEDEDDKRTVRHTRGM